MVAIRSLHPLPVEQGSPPSATRKSYFDAPLPNLPCWPAPSANAAAFAATSGARRAVQSSAAGTAAGSAESAQQLGTVSVGVDVEEGEDGGHVGPMMSRQLLRTARGGELSDDEEEVDGSTAIPKIRRVPEQEQRMLAAVDMGTNSFHMVVVKADNKGRFEIEDVEKEDVRLGSGSSGFAVITPEAEERALAAVRRLKQIAKTRGAAIRVVATSAVREARNRRSFVRRVLDTTGIDVEVLSGQEEACLIYLGILQALPVYHKTVLTVDIGGGSTEFVIGREGKPLFATSLKLGHIRLTEKFACGCACNVDVFRFACKCACNKDDRCTVLLVPRFLLSSLSLGLPLLSSLPSFPVSCISSHSWLLLVLPRSGGVSHRQQILEMRRYVRVLLADSGVLEVVKGAENEIELAIGSSGTIETIEQMIHQSRASGTISTGSAATIATTSTSGSSSGSGSSSNGSLVASGGQSGRSSGGGGKGGGGAASGVTQSQEAVLRRLADLKDREFTLEELSAVVKKICKAKTPEARAKLPGLPEKRADVILGGAILLEEIFLAMGINKMRVSPYALREGVIVDTLSRTFTDFSITPDLRRSSVLKMAGKFNTGLRKESALHCARLAQQILAGMQTCKMGGSDCVSPMMALLDGNDFEVLEAATVLHYVGMFISHKGYHKHSYYLIKHSEQLLGYSPMEVEMIALLVRHHRKRPPSSKDEDFAKLPPVVQQKIKALCAIMRIAVALDRCYTGAAASVLVLQDDDSCVLAVTPAVDPLTGAAQDVSLEMWAARGELEYFHKIFKKAPSIVIADDLDTDLLLAEQSRSLSS
ncbi:unnamed protein product [Closterium sp. Yama58-4]|nr:unnamed protein product [Closterium sp. Yama58-4]